MVSNSTLPVPAPDFYAVHYQEQPALLRGCLLRSLSGQELTEACEMMLTAALRHNCRYWLLNGSANCCRPPFDMHSWLEEEYLPRVLAALGRPPCLAYILPLHWQEELGMGCWASANTAQLAMHRTELFENEAPAISWLNRCRAW